MTEDELDTMTFPIPITDVNGDDIYIGKRRLMLDQEGRWHQYFIKLEGGGETPDDLKGAFTLVDFAISAARSYKAKYENGETKSDAPVDSEPLTKREARKKGYEEKAAQAEG